MLVLQSEYRVTLRPSSYAYRSNFVIGYLIESPGHFVHASSRDIMDFSMLEQKVYFPRRARVYKCDIVTEIVSVPYIHVYIRITHIRIPRLIGSRRLYRVQFVPKRFLIGFGT